MCHSFDYWQKTINGKKLDIPIKSKLMPIFRVISWVLSHILGHCDFWCIIRTATCLYILYRQVKYSEILIVPFIYLFSSLVWNLVNIFMGNVTDKV